MAILLSTPADYLMRLVTGLLLPTEDSTYMVWAREGASIAVSPAYTTPFALLDVFGFALQSVSVRSNTVGTRLDLTGAADITTTPASANQWNHYAWVQSGTTQLFYRNGLLIGSQTLDRSGFSVQTDMLGGDTMSNGGLTLAYARQWSRALTRHQILAERNAPVAVDTTDLWLDTPLETNISDISGHSRHWTLEGSATFVDPPRSVIADTYTDSASFPITRLVTVAEANVTGDLWFKWEVSADSGLLLGNFATRNPALPFAPRSEQYYLVDSTNSTVLFSTVGGATRGWWVYLPTGHYYQRYLRDGGGAISADYTITWSKALVGNTTMAIGTLLVNDDSAPGLAVQYPRLPGVALDLTAGQLLQFVPNVPAGETGDALPFGISLWHDRYGRSADTTPFARLTLLASDLSVLDVVDLSPTIGTTLAPIAQDRSDFYVVRRSTGTVSRVTPTGLVTDDLATLTGLLDVQALGVSPEGIAYWAAGDASSIIYRHDLNLDAPLSDLYDVTATLPPGGTFLSLAVSGINHNPGEILVLGDGTLVTYWLYHLGGETWENFSVLSHISAEGVLLHEYTFDAYTDRLINHIHYALEDPAEITIWFYPESDDTRGIFAALVLADGTLLDVLAQDLFADSANQNNLGFTAASPNPNPFGPSSSCTMVMLGYGGELTEPPVPSPIPSCPTSEWTLPTEGGGVMPAEEF